MITPSQYHHTLSLSTHFPSHCQDIILADVADGALKVLDTDVVFADKFKLDEVLRNLISNALKFSSRNSRVSVRVGFRPCVSVQKDVNNSLVMVQSSSSRERGSSVNRAVSVLGRTTSLVLRGLRNSLLLSHRQRKVAGSDGSNRVGVVRDPKGVDDDMEAGLNTLTGGAATPAAVSNHGNTQQPRRESRKTRTAGNLFLDSIKGRDGLGVGDVTGELIVVVTDIGVGISKENQKLLFQEGMQFDPEKLQTGGGSGFGLYISKSIVELHGGSMEVFSEGEGKGCSFLYRIPMTRQRPDADMTVPTEKTAEALLADHAAQNLSPSGKHLVMLDRSSQHSKVSVRSSVYSKDNTNRHNCAHTLRAARSGLGGGGAGGGGGGIADQKSDNSLPPHVSPSPPASPIRTVLSQDRHVSPGAPDAESSLRRITSLMNFASMMEVLEMDVDLPPPSSPPRIHSPARAHSRQGSRQLTAPTDFSPRQRSASPPSDRSPPIDGSRLGLSPTGSTKKQPPPSSPSLHVLIAGGGPVGTPSHDDDKKDDELRAAGQASQKQALFKPALSVIPAGDKDSVCESLRSPSTPSPGLDNVNGGNDDFSPKSSAHGSFTSPLIIRTQSPAPRPTRKKDRQLTSSGKGATAGGSTGPRYHVLVVDDSAMSR